MNLLRYHGDYLGMAYVDGLRLHLLFWTPALVPALASTSVSRLAAAPTPASITVALSTTFGLVLRGRAYKGIVNRQCLVKQFGAVEGAYCSRGFRLSRVLDQDIALL